MVWAGALVLIPSITRIPLIRAIRCFMIAPNPHVTEGLPLEERVSWTLDALAALRQPG